MSRTALRSFIQRIHFYGGMFVGPFILIAALTGCFYAMAPTLEKATAKTMQQQQPKRSARWKATHLHSTVGA